MGTGEVNRRSEPLENERLVSENWNDDASDTDGCGTVLEMGIQDHDESISTGKLMILTVGAIG